MKSLKLGIISILSIISLNSLAAERWYNQGVVNHGAGLFQQHCASCHGSNAEGTSDWKTPDENGVYPPPPLNGSAHTWHHSIPVLVRTIKEGGAKLGGVMPPFADKLSDQDILAIIGYFQSKWPDDIYTRWHNHFMQ